MKSLMKTAALGATSLLILVATAWATDYTSDATVLATFECPESLKDDATRAAAGMQFLTWIRARHPHWSISKVIGYRLYLLNKHHCDQSLARIRSEASQHPGH